MRKAFTRAVGPLTLVMSLSSPGWAITVGPFGPFGGGGSANGQTFTIGPGGEVFELDAFLNIGGGMSAQLSLDPLPAGLNFAFATSLSPDATDLTLMYTFSNNTGGVLDDVQFFSFIDAQIDEPINGFFNEFGEVVGAPGAGAADADPDSWEIDESGFVSGNIFTNLLLGTLDNTNAVPIGAPEDVSLALGFNLGSLGPLDTARVNILLSEDGSSVGSLALVQRDSDPNSPTVITLSGRAVGTPVPEPGTLLFVAAGLAGLAGLRGKVKPVV